MELDRAKLHAAVKLVEAAVAAKHSVQAFERIAFDGERVQACDEVVAVSVPARTPFKGCVPGAVASKWIASARGKTVTADTSKADTLALAAGRSRVALPLFELKTSPFAFPDMEDALTLKATTGVLECLAAAARVMDSDAGVVWRMGVTLELHKGRARMFSGTDMVLCLAECKAQYKGELGTKHVFSLSPRFVQLVLSMGKAHKLERIVCAAEHTCAHFAGDLRVWGSVVGQPDPSRFAGVVVPVLEGIDAWVPTPAGFQAAMERVLTLAPHYSGDERATAVIEVLPSQRAKDKGMKLLRITANCAGYRQVEALSVSGKHPDCKASLVVEDIQAILPAATQEMHVDDERCAMVFRCSTEVSKQAYLLSLVS